MLEIIDPNIAAQDGFELSFEEFKKIVVNDYRLVLESRQASMLGRKEVLTGKAKFGIFGDQRFLKMETLDLVTIVTRLLCLPQVFLM